MYPIRAQGQQGKDPCMRSIGSRYYMCIKVSPRKDKTKTLLSLQVVVSDVVTQFQIESFSQTYGQTEN